jgi:hypothetical protein
LGVQHAPLLQLWPVGQAQVPPQPSLAAEPHPPLHVGVQHWPPLQVCPLGQLPVLHTPLQPSEAPHALP